MNSTKTYLIKILAASAVVLASLAFAGVPALLYLLTLAVFMAVVFGITLVVDDARHARRARRNR